MEEKTQIENPPAFPFEYTGSDGFGDPARRTEPGMTLRDYFAAKAMQGRLAKIYNDDGEKTVNDINIANEAYRIADAMLKARMKPIE